MAIRYMCDRCEGIFLLQTSLFSLFLDSNTSYDLCDHCINEFKNVFMTFVRGKDESSRRNS
jgi:hypothetical protein